MANNVVQELLKARVTAKDFTFLDGLKLAKKERRVLEVLCTAAAEQGTTQKMQGVSAKVIEAGLLDAQITHLGYKGLVERGNRQDPGCTILPLALKGLIEPDKVKPAVILKKQVRGKKNKREKKPPVKRASDQNSLLTSKIHQALLEKAVEKRIVCAPEFLAGIAAEVGCERSYVTQTINLFVRRAMFTKQKRNGKEGFVLNVMADSEIPAALTGDDETDLQPDLPTKQAKPENPSAGIDLAQTLGSILGTIDSKLKGLVEKRNGIQAQIQELEKAKQALLDNAKAAY